MMGTRADFYVGKGKDAEWLGSIAYDGYPDGNPADVIKALGEHEYREHVATLMKECESATRPEQGWPWPWEDSRTTDYAYTWAEGKVQASGFGSPWFAPGKEPVDMDAVNGPRAEFPNMKDRQRVTFGKRSGTFV